MTNLIYDGNFNSPQPINPVRLSYPIQGFTPLREYQQDFVQKAGNYAPPLMGQRHYTYTDAFLCHQTGFQNLGGGLVQFTWHYMTTPPESYTEPVRVSMTYPAQIAQTLSVSGTARDAGFGKKEYTKAVTGKLVSNFFFLEDSFDPVAGSQVNYNGRIYTISRVTVDEETGTKFYNLAGTNANLTRSQFQAVGDVSPTRYKQIPISQKFEPKLKYAYYIKNGQSYEKYEQEVRVDYISQYTTPTIDEFYQLEFIQAEETEIVQVLGACWKTENLLVPPA